MKKNNRPCKNRIFITAEIGTNHLGDLQIVKKIIDVVSKAGCDAVKFQKKNVEKIYSKNFLDSYLESPWGKTQREMRLHREFSDEQFKKIAKYCKQKKIEWFVSCWDIDSQLQMKKFKTKFNKVSSAMLVHEKLLHLIAEEHKYTFISTGMSTLKQIKKAVQIFRAHKCSFELMHSHGAYPMPIEEANLRVIQTLRKKFKCDVGYSGHEPGSYLLCVLAVMLGATSIERHVTLNRTFYGHDQAASLEPSGLVRMVKDIRSIDMILGDDRKRIWKSEILSMKKLRQVFA